MTRLPADLSLRGTALALALALAGCSSVENLVAGDKVDYRTAGAVTKPAGLEVPPDLTQLARDSRYQSQGGTVSAAAFQAGTGAAAAAPVVPTVAPVAQGDIRIERQGNQRWLTTPQAPELLWPQLQAFWKERGFTLVQDEADSGVMETEWAENRAKLPNDIIRNSIGKIFDALYSTGERDKFRTRVERTAAGSEVYITHRGMVEVYTNEKKDSTIWQPRPADPQLEAEFLSRLMLKLAPKDDKGQSSAAAGPAAAPARARLLEGRPAATLQVDDDFERAWRRVGLTLDRSGFTVEDRDRTMGLYFVRYLDASQPGKAEPGFFGKLFGFGKKDEAAAPTRYRVSVVGSGDSTAVSVLNSTGGPDNGPVAQRIAKILVDDLK